MPVQPSVVPPPVPRSPAHALVLAGALLATVLLGACSTPAPQIKVPARLQYLEAEVLADQQLYAEAVTRFQEAADQNPGTRLGSFAYLRIAELQMAQENWGDAEVAYKQFLTLNSNSHLTSYVLFRLMEAHHRNSYTGLIFKTREVDRDMEPNRQLIREYKRFYFLYPRSEYLDQAVDFYRQAKESLAAHERMVGDYYYEREQYNAAASRYFYLLRHYPEFKDAPDVLDSLIDAYRRNQQPELAREMERIRAHLYGARRPKPAAPSLNDESGGATQGSQQP